MRDLRDNIITSILMVLIVIIMGTTIYFCLDIFEIIDVPEKYSIASFFYSQMDVIVAGQDFSEEDVQDKIKKYVVSDTSNYFTEEVSAEALENILNVMEQPDEEIQSVPENNSKRISAKYFYYDQLDQYGKIIYDGLYSNINELKTGTYTCNFGLQFNDLLHEDNGDKILADSFQQAINALIFDNPELFYLDVTKMYLLTEITTRAFSKSYEVKIGANGESYLSAEYGNVENVNEIIKNIRELKKELVGYAEEKEDKVEKIKYIHDYLVDTIEYDLNAGSTVYNIYGALFDKRAVCEGYATSFKYLLDEMGIPCIVVCGVGQNKAGEIESHAWNYVQLDGSWYAIDVTWDDPVIEGGKKNSSKRYYDYYLKGSESLFKDHREDSSIIGMDNLKYPTLNVLDY